MSKGSSTGAGGRSELLGFVLRSSGRIGALMAALGLAGAALNALLIATVHRALEPVTIAQPLALAFVGLGVAKVATAHASAQLTERHAQRSIAELRRQLMAKVLEVAYRRLEELGVGRVQTVLTSDVSVLGAALQGTATAVVHAAVLIGGVGYLAYLDPRAALTALLLALASFVAYRAMARRANAALRRSRDGHDRFFTLAHAATLGGKELRLHRERRRAFFEGPIEDAIAGIAQHDFAAQSRYLAGQAANNLLVLGAIGLLLFVLPERYGLRASVVSGYVLTGLYLAGPLASLLRLVPLYEAASISLRHVGELGAELSGSGLEPAAPSPGASFDAIELRGVTYRYGDAGFSLGPISLRLAPSEILLVTGGNGSGKSTLAKLLCGLYEPLEGEVRCDDRVVTANDRDAYRQLWSAVFADGHVFDRFYGLGQGLEAGELDRRARAACVELGLDGVVTIEDGAPSSIDLSLGQRKRLALLTALLEDRPIYLFDEWAAEQDPAFKDAFYRTWLPRLRARGKAVVVISHDDRYFEVADRRLVLESGAAR